MASSSSAADVSITREQLTKYFHLPITDVAKELGICATMLKKICRKNGIPRWPHRKIKSLNKMIESLEASLTNDGSEAGECIRQEIIILKNKKSLIMRNPSILVQGNSNKRSSEGGDEQPAGKKARAEAIQAPVTTFNNPKSSLPTAPNSFSINQLLTPPTNFSSPLTSATGMDEKDYRAYAHHASAHGYPPHHMIMPYSDPSRPDSKSHMEGRSFSSPLTSYLPEDDGRHMEGAPMMHSSDPYYYHKLAYQYYPRQMLPPSAYPPPPPHTLSASPHHARSSYYLPFGGPSSHEARPGQQHLITDGHSEASPTGDLQEQQTQQPHHPQQPTSTPSQQQAQQTQNQQQAQQQITQAQKTQQQQQQQQQQLTQRATMQQQQQQTQPQQTQQQQESLPKMNIPSSSPDMYKYARNPPSPQSSSTSSPFPQGSEMPYYYHQYPTSQTQRLHQQQ